MPFHSGQVLTLRSLNLKTDLPILHHWVNEPYARDYWQMEGDLNSLQLFYQKLLRDPESHSFIGLLDEQLICQIDCYRVQADELGKHLSVGYDDCGLHLLMAPRQHVLPGLSSKVMELFLRYYFSYEQAYNLYAEPDIYNHKACQLLGRSRFHFMQNIMLSTKAASVYLITRKHFYETYPVS